MRCLLLILLLTVYSSYSQSNNESIESLQESLNEAFKNDDFELGKKISLKILDLDSNEAVGYLGLAHYWNKTKVYDSAIRYYNKANEIRPTYETYLDLAEIYNRLNKPDLEMECINRAIYYETYYSKQMLLDMVEMGVIDNTDTLILKLGNNNNALDRRIEWNMARENYDDALDDLTSKIEWDDSPKNYYDRGILYLHLENYKLALQDFNHSIFVSDRMIYKAHIRKAYCMAMIGNIQQSNSIFEKLYNDLGVDKELFYFWGKSLIENGQKDEGCKKLTKAKELGFTDSSISTCN